MSDHITVKDAATLLIAEAREQLEMNEKERAVIEAAKAMHEGLKGNPAVEYAEREILDLDVAVEALLAAEGEE